MVLDKFINILKFENFQILTFRENRYLEQFE
jgi:hypothetical protein